MNLLEIQNLSVLLDDKQILFDINLKLRSGEIHVIMGPNGSGKSTLAMAMAGHPNYKVKSQSFDKTQDDPEQSRTGQKSKVKINNKNLLTLKPEERAREGLFVSFQQPVSIPGVSVTNFLRLAVTEIAKSQNIITTKANNAPNCPTGTWLKPTQNSIESFHDFYQRLKQAAQMLKIPVEFLARSLNDNFSGGEKKKIEMLQALILKPKFAVFDEIDTGLDIDALKLITDAIIHLAKQNTGVIVITHHVKLLKLLTPKTIHVLLKGKIVTSGNLQLADRIEKNGFKSIQSS